MTKGQKYYRKYLRSDHWKALRQLKLEEAGAVCGKCGGTSLIEVHHLKYHERYEDCTTADLAVLCGPCHSAEHGREYRRFKDGAIGLGTAIKNAVMSPELVAKYGEASAKLIAVAKILQAGSDMFFLSYRDIGRINGRSPFQAMDEIAYLTDMGVLELVKKGDESGKANRYKVLI